MKTVKAITGWVLFVAFLFGIGELHNALSSNVSGVPTNPTFGTVTATAANIGLGTGTAVPTLVGVGNISSGKVLAFEITNSGSCSLKTGSFPTGWSVSFGSAGVCNFTMPFVSTATLVVETVTPLSPPSVQTYCSVNNQSTTGFSVHCAQGSSLANTDFAVIVIDEH